MRGLAPSMAPADTGAKQRQPIRLTVVMSHPIQYMAPLFRHIASECPDLDLTVVYLTLPTRAQQGSGFGVAFSWDVPLLEGYRWRISRQPRSRDAYDRFLGLDDPRLPELVLETNPQVVLVSGWQFAGLLRTVLACRAANIPVLYRGDSSLLQAPTGWRRTLWEVRTRALLRQFDGHLAVGRRARDYLAHFGAREDRVFDSPHCVDVNHFARQAAPYREPEARRQLRSELGLDPTTFVGGFVGKLEEKKRPLDLIRAAARLQTPIELLFAGRGPLERECQDEARRLGVSVAWAGFVNQGQLGRIYAACDVLVLPSDSGETWGLVVNEAMACGVPCIVSDRVGCAPDMVTPGVTGNIVPFGDVDALARALESTRTSLSQGVDFGPACRERAAMHSVRVAAEGLAAAARALARPRSPSSRSQDPRVLAAISEFVVMGGLERMTIEVLRTLSGAGVRIHCLVNPISSHVGETAARAADATSSIAPVLPSISMQLARDPEQLVRSVIDVARASTDLLRQLRSARANHVFVPTHLAVLRNLPGMFIARASGARVVMRLGNPPAPGQVQAAIWRYVVDPCVDLFVCNSEFSRTVLLSTGVTATKTRVIHNCLGTREGTDVRPRDQPGPFRRARRRVVYVGQIIPEKGVLELLEAFAATSKVFDDLRLDVVGRITGWERPEHAGYMEAVRRRAELSDLRGRVSFLGWREDVASVLTGAALHCCPSAMRQYESFANVCLEAKAAGLPSVVSPSGSLPEIIRHRIDGWVCGDDGVAALAEGLQALLSLPEPELAAMGRAAADDLDRRFSQERFRQEWLDVFFREGPAASRLARYTPDWALPTWAILSNAFRGAVRRT